MIFLAQKPEPVVPLDTRPSPYSRTLTLLVEGPRFFSSVHTAMRSKKRKAVYHKTRRLYWRCDRHGPACPANGGGNRRWVIRERCDYGFWQVESFCGAVMIGCRLSRRRIPGRSLCARCKRKG